MFTNPNAGVEKKVERICIAAFSSCYRASAAHTRRNFKVPGLFTLARNQSGAIQCRRTRTETHSLIQVRAETGRAKKSCLRKKIPGDAEGKKLFRRIMTRTWLEWRFLRRPRAHNSLFNLLKLFHSRSWYKKERKTMAWLERLTNWVNFSPTVWLLPGAQVLMKTQREHV